jgi:hypothetical protein
MNTTLAELLDADHRDHPVSTPAERARRILVPLGYPERLVGQTTICKAAVSIDGATLPVVRVDYVSQRGNTSATLLWGEGLLWDKSVCEVRGEGRAAVSLRSLARTLAGSEQDQGRTEGSTASVQVPSRQLSRCGDDVQGDVGNGPSYPEGTSDTGRGTDPSNPSPEEHIDMTDKHHLLREMAAKTCEKCGERPVHVTLEADGVSIAMLRTGHLVCARCRRWADRLAEPQRAHPIDTDVPMTGLTYEELEGPSDRVTADCMPDPPARTTPMADDESIRDHVRAVVAYMLSNEEHDAAENGEDGHIVLHLRALSRWLDSSDELTDEQREDRDADALLVADDNAIIREMVRRGLGRSIGNLESDDTDPTS